VLAWPAAELWARSLGAPDPAPKVPKATNNIFDVFPLTISPDAPLSELLPTPPKSPSLLEPVVTKSLDGIPELAFQKPPSKNTAFGTSMALTTRTAQKILFLNKKKADGFLHALLDTRPDLRGLPFMLGAQCQMKEERALLFKVTLDALNSAFAKFKTEVLATPGLSASDAHAIECWNCLQQHESLAEEQPKTRFAPLPKAKKQLLLSVRVDLTMHILGAQGKSTCKGLIKYLGGISHVEATHALARLALFAVDAEVRQAALEALSVRREKDYTDILLKGFHYPWPVVASHAAEALVHLKPADLVGQLVDLLDEPDPRLPQVVQVNGKELFQARQLVRLNHNYNCFLCHAPLAPSDELSATVVTGQVPQPDRALPSFTEAYHSSSQVEVRVRVDKTYLRPDFSALVKAEAPKKWPEKQRFDFLVRTVNLTKSQAQIYTTAIKTQEGAATPYHEAVLMALRALTGQDAGTTAAAWRKALKLPG
jgi:hypothetical protein